MKKEDYMGFREEDVREWLNETNYRLWLYENREKNPDKYKLEDEIRHLNYLFYHDPQVFPSPGIGIPIGVVLFVLFSYAMMSPSLPVPLGWFIMGIGAVLLIYMVVSIARFDEVFEKKRKEIAERRKALLEEYIRKYIEGGQDERRKE